MDKAVRPLTLEEQDEVLAELRWYGKTIAGGGPMVGFDKAARRANTHWYETTLPLLMRFGHVYASDADTQTEGEER